MPFFHLCKKVLPAAVVLAALYLSSSLLRAQNQPKAVAATKAKAKPQACPNDDSGLELPAGFCAHTPKPGCLGGGLFSESKADPPFFHCQNMRELFPYGRKAKALKGLAEQVNRNGPDVSQQDV